MEKCTCGICFEIYDGTRHLPKCLGCGHTLCSVCLDKLLIKESGSLCPYCNATIARDGSYPTIFLFLIKDEIKELTSFKERFSEEFLRFTKETTEVAKKQKSVDSFVKVCNDLISTFNDVSDRISSKLHLNEAIEKSNEVNKKLNSLKVSSKICVKLSDYEDHKQFPLQLLEKAKVGPVFAVNSVEKRDFFGSVRFEGQKCYIYSMSSEDIDRRSNATFVNFQDLKLCFMDTEFEAFLEISTIGGATVRPEIRLRYLNVTNFVNLCTGELGLSYKGVACNTNVQYFEG